MTFEPQMPLTICVDCIHMSTTVTPFCYAPGARHMRGIDPVSGLEAFVDKSGKKVESPNPLCCHINRGNCPHYRNKN